MQSSWLKNTLKKNSCQENNPTPEEPEKEYASKEVGIIGEDTATGFLKSANYKANPSSGNWFQAQELDFTNTDAIDLDIQAGNFKNGTNFVGKLYLTKTGNIVTMNYKVLDELATLPPVSR